MPLFNSLVAQAAAEPFKLEGLAIGNGLTDPAIQYGSYADFAFANGLISRNLQNTINAVSCLGPTAQICCYSHCLVKLSSWRTLQESSCFRLVGWP
jgi:carboxypeptidase C (cathepsin A)